MSKVSSTVEILGLSKPPIAIGFFESPPAGVPLWDIARAQGGLQFIPYRVASEDAGRIVPDTTRVGVVRNEAVAGNGL